MDANHKVKFKSALEAAVDAFGLDPLTDAQLASLNRHYSMVLDWNRHINLTRITTPDDAARFHYAESLFGARFIGDARTLLDIGSGAGFPAVPIATVRSDIRVTALEPDQKKALYLCEVKDALGLSNLAVARSRIEHFSWEQYDLLMSRALDSADKILASVASRLSPPQRLMLFCGPNLIERVTKRVAPGYSLEIHAIPQAETRTVAVLSPKSEGTGQRADALL